jgi:hypothetical protein
MIGMIGKKELGALRTKIEGITIGLKAVLTSQKLVEMTKLESDHDNLEALLAVDAKAAEEHKKAVRVAEDRLSSANVNLEGTRKRVSDAVAALNMAVPAEGTAKNIKAAMLGMLYGRVATALSLPAGTVGKYQKIQEGEGDLQTKPAEKKSRFNLGGFFIHFLALTVGGVMLGIGIMAVTGLLKERTFFQGPMQPGMALMIGLGVTMVFSSMATKSFTSYLRGKNEGEKPSPIYAIWPWIFVAVMASLEIAGIIQLTSITAANQKIGSGGGAKIGVNPATYFIPMLFSGLLGISCWFSAKDTVDAEGSLRPLKERQDLERLDVGVKKYFLDPKVTVLLEALSDLVQVEEVILQQDLTIPEPPAKNPRIAELEQSIPERFKALEEWADSPDV